MQLQVESSWHQDGRGVRVDSTVALFLPVYSQFKVLRCLLALSLRPYMSLNAGLPGQPANIS